MKRIAFAFGLGLVLTWFALASAQSFTPNLNLCKPSDSQVGWGPCLRGNFDVLDFEFEDPLVRSGTTISCPTCSAATFPLDVDQGGTGLDAVALGQLLYGSAADTYSLLNGNTSTSRQILAQTGTGSASAAPAWVQLAASDFAAVNDHVALIGPTSGGPLQPTFRLLVDDDIPDTITIDEATTALALATDPTACPNPGEFVTDIDADGTLTCGAIDETTFADQAANTFLGGPSSGVDASPAFRLLEDDDIPDGITITDITQITNRDIDDLTGELDPTVGGTGLTSYVVGNMIYSDAADSLAALAPNTVADERFLAMTGTGSAGAAPIWTLLDDGNIPDSITITNLTQVTVRDANDLQGTTLAATVVNTSITGVGALASGTIAAGFGEIDNGLDDISGGTFEPAEDTRSIADSGDASPATLTLSPTTSYVAITCNDADGCDITLGEGSAENGDLIVITNVSANVANFADSSGVSELAGAFAMGQYDTLVMLYATDRWVEVSRSNN